MPTILSLRSDTLGFSIRVTADRGKLIVTAKHPVMAGCESLVRAALEAPDEVRQSRMDSQVLLFYKAEAARRWTCAVAKRAAEGAFLINRVSDRRHQGRRS